MPSNQLIKAFLLRNNAYFNLPITRFELFYYGKMNLNLLREVYIEKSCISWHFRQNIPCCNYNWKNNLYSCKEFEKKEDYSNQLQQTCFQCFKLHKFKNKINENAFLQTTVIYLNIEMDRTLKWISYATNGLGAKRGICNECCLEEYYQNSNEQYF